MSRASIRRAVRNVFLFGWITFGLFLLFEGTASFLIFLRALQTQREMGVRAEVAHADYDPELGWVNRKGVRIDDFYGPDKDLVLNNQGFRDEEDFTQDVPRDTRRVICSGDSFTMGVGVGNRDTWCAMLESLSPGLQTVNMGQGGYGLGQAYLWYLRDGLELEHDAQLLAFNRGDFLRLGVREFLGYGKPKLSVEADELRVEPARWNGPVKRWLAKNGYLFRELRSVEFLGRAARKIGIAEEVGGANERMRTWEIAEAIFEDLAERHRTRGTELVLVFLPTPWDTMWSIPSPGESWSRITRLGPGPHS